MSDRFTAVTGATYTAAQYNTNVRDELDALEAKIEGQYPIGMIIELYVSTNPATLFGYGTWAAYGAGRVTVGIDATDADFDTVGETIGEKTHTMTEAELAPHVHAVQMRKKTNSQNVDGGAIAVPTTSLETYNSESTGSGTPFNVVQPSIVVYRWRRTA